MACRFSAKELVLGSIPTVSLAIALVTLCDKCYTAFMTDYVKRLVYIDEMHHIRINPLVWPFLVTIIVYGIGFAFFSHTGWVSSSSLFNAMRSVHHWLPSIWGVFATASGLSAMAMVLLRKSAFGSIAAMSGFLVWLFSLIMYIFGGYFLVAVAVSGANLYFWTYYYFRLRWYVSQKSLGQITDPE